MTHETAPSSNPVLRIAAAVAITGMLASCTTSLTTEQSAKLDREYRPIVVAAIPACIAKASGRQTDYRALHALGYSQRASYMGEGEYLYPAGKSSIFDKEGIRFATGEGCYAATVGVPGVLYGGMDAIGQTWIRALQSAGYQAVDGNSSSYRFVANGVPLMFYGRRSSEDGMITMAIVRDN